jgi:catalase
MSEQNSVDENSKNASLDNYRKDAGEKLTTDDGHAISTTDNSLKAGTRGPTLLEDFHFQEKTASFDRERIPERVVHARGSGAHGYFQPYESMAEFTKAKFLADPSVKTFGG